MTDSEKPGQIEITSHASFDATLDRLIEAMARSGMTLHVSTMPPTTLLIYGSPAGGTPVMLAAPLAALDLPLRVLVRENDQGQVSILFHPMAPVLRQAGVPETLAHRLDQAQHMLVEAVS